MLSKSVFSTSVEVFPQIERAVTTYIRLLHVRGGVSKTLFTLCRYASSSPRPWRCFFLHLRS